MGAPRGIATAWMVVAAALAAAIAARLLAGGTLDTPAWAGIIELRGQRACVGLIVGAALGAAGAVLQALMRNPLAGPEVLGVSPGASLAVVVASWLSAGLGLSGFDTLAWSALPALLGAGGALALVYALSQRRGLVEPQTLVLTGVVVGTLAGAGILLVQHLAGGFIAARALIGSLSDDADWGVIASAGGPALAALACAAWLGPTLDASMLGDDEAASVGVRVGPARTGAFCLAGLLVALAVALAGPVGFIGLIAPHMARGLTRMAGGHRVLVTVSAGLGAALVVGGDALTRVLPLGGGRLPLGILTTALGGPVFLFMLRRSGGLSGPAR